MEDDTKTTMEVVRMLKDLGFQVLVVDPESQRIVIYYGLERDDT